MTGGPGRTVLERRVRREGTSKATQPQALLFRMESKPPTFASCSDLLARYVVPRLGSVRFARSPTGDAESAYVDLLDSGGRI